MDYDLEALYQQGYEVGFEGVPLKCPQEIYDYEDHAVRDAWINGYKAGLHEYKLQTRGYNLGNIHDERDAHGALWFDAKDANGFIAIRDCEGGTILAKVQMKDDVRVLIPKQNVSPEMAQFVGRAIQKAASLAYRTQQTRKFRPGTMEEMHVPPIRSTPGIPGFNEVLELQKQAEWIRRRIKGYYWRRRKDLPVEGYIDDLLRGLDQLRDELSKLDK